MATSCNRFTRVTIQLAVVVWIVVAYMPYTFLQRTVRRWGAITSYFNPLQTWSSWFLLFYTLVDAKWVDLKKYLLCARDPNGTRNKPVVRSAENCLTCGWPGRYKLRGPCCGWREPCVAGIVSRSRASSASGCVTLVPRLRCISSGGDGPGVLIALIGMRTCRDINRRLRSRLKVEGRFHLTLGMFCDKT